MKYPKILIPVFSVLLITSFSCKMGGSLKKIHVANHPSGDQIKVELQDKDFPTIRGELLAIHENSVYLLNQEMEIIQIMYVAARSMVIGRNKNLMQYSGRPKPEKIDELRLYARYPQGITEEVKGTLLSAYDQNSIIIINDKMDD
jgi:hypothetical protein